MTVLVTGAAGFIGEHIHEALLAAGHDVAASDPADGAEARVVAHLSQTHPDLVEALRADGATILIGERAARVPGLLSVADALATATGAHLAWVPRRSGERGGIGAVGGRGERACGIGLRLGFATRGFIVDAAVPAAGRIAGAPAAAGGRTA